MIGAIKAKEEARKIGTERRVIIWKGNVPAPAPNKATLGSSPSAAELALTPQMQQTASPCPKWHFSWYFPCS